MEETACAVKERYHNLQFMFRGTHATVSKYSLSENNEMRNRHAFQSSNKQFCAMTKVVCAITIHVGGVVLFWYL